MFTDININNYIDNDNDSYYFYLFNVEILIALEKLKLNVNDVELLGHIFTFKTTDGNIILKYSTKTLRCKINFTYNKNLKHYKWEEIFNNDEMFSLKSEPIKVLKKEP